MTTKRSRARGRDPRRYDTSSLREAEGRRALMRDYSAHFFRWSFARRLVRKTDRVLDVGCGAEAPLMSILTVGVGGRRCASYTGVDLVPLRETDAADVELMGGFDFVARHRELADRRFDVVTCLEVVEHMRTDLARRALRAMVELLQPRGRLIISTPVYDRVHHAANHIYEWTAEELAAALRSAGLLVERRFGCHMDLRKIGRQHNWSRDITGDEVSRMKDALGEYFDDDALSCIFAPLHPDAARSCLWLCTKV